MKITVDKFKEMLDGMPGDFELVVWGDENPCEIDKLQVSKKEKVVYILLMP